MKDVKSKELVWVKHSKDPFWPALVSCYNGYIVVIILCR